MDELERMQKKLAREKLAREQAENIAEDKTREIFIANKELEVLTKSLEEKVIERTADLHRAKEEAEDVQYFLENLLDSAKEVAIIATDAEGNISKFNSGASNLIGIEGNDACLINIHRFLDYSELNKKLASVGNEQEVLFSLYELSQSEQSKSLELTILNAKQERIICSVSISWIATAEKNRNGYLFIIKDIRVRKKIERMQSEFISTVSHELRTPLTSICGSLTLILRGKLGDIPSSIISLLSIAEKNAKRLTSLINDILDMEKIVAGKMKLNMKPYTVNELICQAIDENYSYAEQFNVKIDLKGKVEDQKVVVDDKRFLQIMANLLSNAVKFSNEGDTVEINVIRQKGKVKIAVIDHGAGIPDSFRNKIFQKFSQADSSDTRKVGGTGLGLSISKELAHKMQGLLSFKSIEGVGTTFFLELPELQPVKQLMSKETFSNKDVLIVEDNEDVAHLIKLILEKEGISADYALTAKDAHRCIKHGKYRAMTVDVDLPDKNGMDLIKEIRAIKAYQNIPILVVSGNLQDDVISQDMEHMIVDWLSKPIDQDSLCELIKSSLLQRGDDVTQPQILHIEDDPDIRHILKLQLEGVGEYTGVSSIAEVRQLNDLSCFSVFILDLNLPDGSGVELIDEINQYSTASNIIILSAQELDEAYIDKVKSVFVKSKMSVDDLKNSIKALLIEGRSP